MAVVDSPCVAG